jgi:hypothetical protein
VFSAFAPKTAIPNSKWRDFLDFFDFPDFPDSYKIPNMKKLALLLLVFSVLPACKYNSLPSDVKNANVSASRVETRDVSGFTNVLIANNIAAEITAGADFSVTIEGDDNLLKIVSTVVEDGLLTVALKEKFVRSTRVAVKISMPELKELEVAGASTTIVNNVKGDKLRLQANGATKIKAAGEVKELEAHAYGAGVIDAEALKTTTADVEALGTSNVIVSPTASLKARTAGISTVLYTGDPKVEKTSSNDSSVKKKS